MNRSCDPGPRPDDTAAAFPGTETVDHRFLDVRWLGLVPYRRALREQRELVERVREGRAPDTLLLLEHPPVITLGRSADRGHVLVDDATLAARGIELHESRRGGDVTYHGPGQLVGYPVVALEPGRRDARRYLRDLEEALILAVRELGIRAGRVPGLTGVWVGDRKLAAIGVHLSSGWITSHGFALNVACDLSGFQAIVPCGIRGRGVTSLAELTGRKLVPREVGRRVARRLAEVLERRAVLRESTGEAEAGASPPPVGAEPRSESRAAWKENGGDE